jgi:hypothetical protein
MTGNHGGHRRKISHAQREEILRVYLNNPNEGCALAMSLGLSQIYAYKLAHERGLLPNRYWQDADRCAV